MRVDTRKIVVKAYGLLIELEIEETFHDEFGYPDDRIPASGEVVAATVLDIEDPATAYAEYAMLREECQQELGYLLRNLDLSAQGEQQQ